MKKKILIGICAAVLLVLGIIGWIFADLFLIGNSNLEVAISKIDVFSKKLIIYGETADSGNAFKNYKYKVLNDNVYITLDFVTCSQFYKTGKFAIEKNDDFSKINNVFLISGAKTKLIWNKETNGKMTVYTYKGNIDADGIEIDKVISLYENDKLENNLGSIKNELKESWFNGIDIEIKKIDDAGVLTVDLRDAEKKVVEYIDAGSSGSKIYLDILTNSLLQPESDVRNWISGIRFLLNGVENEEGSHFNLQEVFERKIRDKTLVYITDYGYDGKPEGYDEKLIMYDGTQQFIIKPADDETEIIVNELYEEDAWFKVGKELLRTKECFLLVMELPEGMPYVQVKVQKGDRSSTWQPFFNGKDGTLIVPEEFKIVETSGNIE